MYLIAGLGNPEQDYCNTRHNMGFDVINRISEKTNIQVDTKKFKALYGKGLIDDKQVVLLKPQTFMNLSGESIKECIDFYKIDLNDIIVIYDDIDIEPGKIRIRKRGNSGSHNGIKSVTSMLNTENFARIRVGIGKPQYKYDLIKYVLEYIEDDEREKLEIGIENASEASIEFIKNGIDMSMNKFNNNTSTK